jgi:hypothetical protein
MGVRGVTTAEYAALYAQARRKAARMDATMRSQLASVYAQAADEAAAVVREALDRGLSALTLQTWQAIAGRLTRAADLVATGTESVARNLVTQMASLYPSVDAAFILSSVRLAIGADSRITESGLGRLVSSIDTRLVQSLTSRLWTDGYSFSERVWGSSGVRGDYLERMKMTVAAGLAQGRDPAQIAKDIQVYTADGKVALTQRWGNLEAGTSEFARRLPGRLDWRAQRLVRSELYSSLQESSVMAGEMNPACTGKYDWVLQAGRQHWDCDCEDLAAGGPYAADEIPDYPHPNCGCMTRPRLADAGQFQHDLKAWASGEKVAYLDSWYRTTYKAAA